MGNLVLRLPDDLHEAARQAAKDEDRSMQTLILRALRAYLAQLAPMRPARKRATR
jgi:predicted HicB family RNase H-like nuclease